MKLNIIDEGLAFNQFSALLPRKRDDYPTDDDDRTDGRRTTDARTEDDDATDDGRTEDDDDSGTIDTQTDRGRFICIPVSGQLLPSSMFRS